MLKLQKLILFVSMTIFISVFCIGEAQAQKIIWVSHGDADTLGNVWDQEWVELLVENGYEVQREDSTMWTLPGETTLTFEQLDVLESGDLVIVSRTNSSGNYNDAMGWNSVGKPMILLSAYMSRANRWQWLDSSDLMGGGSYKATTYHAEMPDHPIFTGVELDADDNVAVLDTTVGTGQTSLPAWSDPGDGTLIATMADTGTVTIVHWPIDAAFHANTDQFAAEARLLFTSGTREPAGDDPPNPMHGWGQYNLTPKGEIMFLNAVAWMLGKEVGVDAKPSGVPTEYDLAQNFPNPFNPSTTIAFSLPAATTAKLSIYNMLGQEVATLANQVYQAGVHRATWDGRNNAGQAVESGVYLYKLETEDYSSAKKMLLMK